MTWLIWVALGLGALFFLARGYGSLLEWTVGLAAALLATGATGLLHPAPAIALWLTLLLVLVPLNVPPLRQRLLSAPMLRRIRKVLPAMSDTEREAIEAGSVWWEAELFSGAPDWSRLQRTPAPALSEAEQAFLEGPVEALCRMLDDWRITHELNDLPPEVWAFLKQHGFFGMIIPEEYGGLGFSAYAHSQVVMKVSSRSVTAGVTVMVPNSLGPAELLLHYGTEAQKRHYLPRLARGEEIPCFALTGPSAGSDATSIPDVGIVCKGEHEGREVLGLRVSWEKRYITLGPVATVLGLAFKAFDPDHLLGEQEELGITCALIPTTTPGVQIGRRHYPLGAAFQNGPNSGQDVFIPLDWVIGGREQVGKGWRMLMECLSAGRGISLPALSTGAAKLSSRITGAYARVRRQFRLPIGRFEGVEEALARIAGLTYLMDAARLLTVAALDAGEKPSVATAIVKYQLTEGMRQVLNDAMDVHGGRGICLGPANYLARGYEGVPISITVEGANILTRSMIIFGQGAMRCHPYLVREVAAASDPDRAAGVQAFDAALLGHLGFSARNAARALLYGLSGGWLAPAPRGGAPAGHYRQLARYSAAFAFLADLTLLVLGGGLKRKEKLSGRFADALSHMYLCSAALKRFEDSGRPEADRPLLEWACAHSLARVQDALDGVLRNFPLRGLGPVLRLLVFPLGRRQRRPDDALGQRAAALLLAPSAARDRLTTGIFAPADPADPTGRVEHAMAAVTAAAEAERKLRRTGAQPSPGEDQQAWLNGLAARGVLDPDEAHALAAAHAATRAAIMVDDFAPRRAAGGPKKRAATKRRAAKKTGAPRRPRTGEVETT